MEAAFVANALSGIGICVSIWAVTKALKRAGQSGKYETPMDAMNDQEFWVDVAQKAEGQR